VRRNLNRDRALVLVIGILFALAWAVPSIGSTAGKLARKALGQANLAVHTSNLAVNSAQTANTNANQAKSTANAANSTASAANSTANAANNTANQALSKANSIVTASYARMNQPCSTGSACNIDHAKGVTAIRQTSTAGNYCVTATGRSPGGFTPASWLASVDAGDTSSPLDTAEAEPSTAAGCNSGEFGVQTSRLGIGASDIAFFVVIP
jgi:hypothetical protein